MSWWSKYKKPIIILTISVICLTPLFYIAFAYHQISTGNVFCTMMGLVGEGLTVYVDNTPHPLKSYEIIVDYPFPTPSDKIICDESSFTNDLPNLSPLGNRCILGGAFFPQNGQSPPKSITITVNIEGRSITHKYKPSYHLEYPNGEQCTPSYFATIHFDYSQK